jgi:F0F1-type ATP synthase delta subunit
MSAKEELERLLKDEVLLEIEDYIDELFELVAAKKADDDVKDELKSVQEMKEDFHKMLEDLENDEIDEEEAQEIVDELKEMQEEEE